MPQLRRWAQRARRPLAIGAVAAVAGVAVSLVARSRRPREQAASVCHPNLSRLRAASAEDEAGREVLLIGTPPIDLDGKSPALVRTALDALRPDVVLVEGTWMVGIGAMFFSGTWELHGVTPPGGLNWTDVGEAQPVEIIQQRRRKGLFGFGGEPPAKFPAKSLVPVKVHRWAHHLRGSVGKEVAAAVTAAAASGVPVRFLGPHEDDRPQQGHMLVSLLANQATRELLEEEHQRGSQMPDADVDEALRRAEAHVREDTKKWIQDARSETTRMHEMLRSGGQIPEGLRSKLLEVAEARMQGTASRIGDAMQSFTRGAAILPVDQLVGVEDRLTQAGYEFVSNCA